MSLPEPYYQDDHVTLFHADCRDVLPLVEADVMVTDPPYGTGCAPRGGARAGTIDTASAIAPAWDQFDVEWLKLWKGPAAVFVGIGRVFELADAMSADGLLIYVKSNPNPFGSSYEPCLTRGFGWVRGRQHFVAYNAVNGQQHPTQKPIDLMRWVAEVTPPGVIVDPFAGSGSTLRAAKDLGRTAIGIEVDERYCKVAAARMRQEVLDFGGAA